MFALLVKADVGEAVFDDFHFEGRVGQYRQRIGGVAGEAAGVGFYEFVERNRVVGRDPAGAGVRRGRHARFDAVLMLQTVRGHVELQTADRTEQHHRVAQWTEYLDRAFLAELHQAGAQLLGLERIDDLDDVEDFRREERQAGELKVCAVGQRVAELDAAMRRDADDVAGVGFVEQLAALRQERNDVVGTELLAGALDLQAHAALEVSRAHAHEHHAVAVRGIHVRLDLEHDRGEPGIVRIDVALQGLARLRRRGDVHQRIEDFAHAEVVDGRAEEGGRLAAGEEFLARERRRSAAHQLDVGARTHELLAETRLQRRVIEPGDDLFLFLVDPVFAGAEHANAVLRQVINAAEGFAHADRPGEWDDRHAQRLLDFVDQVERFAYFPVHLVDEGDDRRAARPADFQ